MAVLVSGESGRIGAAVRAVDVEVRVGVTVGGITLAGTVNAVDPLEPFRLGTCVAASSLSLHVGPDPVRGADVVWRPAVVGVVGRLRGGIEGGVESVMRPPLTGL
ncbi:hypothetical protein [Cellulomonas sp. P5_C5]